LHSHIFLPPLIIKHSTPYYTPKLATRVFSGKRPGSSEPRVIISRKLSAKLHILFDKINPFGIFVLPNIHHPLKALLQFRPVKIPR